MEEVGGDVAGALTLLPDRVEPPTEPTSDPLDDESLARLLSKLPQRPLAVAGAQPKVPVIIDDDGRMTLPTSSAAPTTHILKPEPKRFPGLVDIETFCMALASASCRSPRSRRPRRHRESGS